MISCLSICTRHLCLYFNYWSVFQLDARLVCKHDHKILLQHVKAMHLFFNLIGYVYPSSPPPEKENGISEPLLHSLFFNKAHDTEPWLRNLLSSRYSRPCLLRKPKSQVEPATCSFPEPDESNLLSYALFSCYPFINLSCRPCRWFIVFWFSEQNLVACFNCSKDCTCLLISYFF